MTGDTFKAWVAENAKLHQELMEKAGFLAKKK
jgi:hypothetical protein